jgi:glucose-1-phosphate cytidylyltransferase
VLFVKISNKLETMYTKDMKVVILCGGKGTRLSEETKLRPKPLVEIGEKPILMHIMQSYMKYGFNNFNLAIGYLGEQVDAFVKKNKLSGKVNVIDTGQDTLTGGRLLRLKSHLVNEKTFMLTYGDGVCNVDLKKIVEFHMSHGKIATVTAVRPPARFGVMKINENRVEYFHEKSQTDAGWINGGYFVFNSEIFNYLKNDYSVLEESPLQQLTNEEELMAFKHEGFWQCMDTLRDKEYLDELCEQGNTPWL